MVDEKFIVPYYDKANLEHVCIARNIGVLLSSELDNNEQLILELAILLHDVGKLELKIKNTSTKEKHDVYGAYFFKTKISNLVKAYLYQLNFSPEYAEWGIKVIYISILFHSSVMGGMEKYKDLWEQLDDRGRCVVVCVYVADTISKLMKAKSRTFTGNFREETVNAVKKRIENLIPEEFVDIKQRAIILMNLLLSCRSKVVY